MLNRAVLTGRITAAPEVHKTQSGLSVCSFTLAVDDGREKDKVHFINCVVWRQGADFLGQYAGKGDLIAVDGRITSRSYTKDGQRVYVTEVVADNVYIEAHKGQNQKNDNFPAEPQNRSQMAQNQPQTGYNQQSYPEEEFGGGFDISSADLPF